jgi:hypothetical protein
VKIDVQGVEEDVVAGFGNVWKTVDLVLIELTFAPEYKNVRPSFSPVCAQLAQHGLYPVIFQRYGLQQSTYGIERDVIFVRDNLLPKVYWKNY